MTKKTIEQMITDLEIDIDNFEKLDEHNKVGDMYQELINRVTNCKDYLQELESSLTSANDNSSDSPKRDETGEYVDSNEEIYWQTMKDINSNINIINDGKESIEESIDRYTIINRDRIWCNKYGQHIRLKIEKEN